MPQGTPISNIFGLIWETGRMYATAYNPDGSARTADLVSHGALAEIGCNYSRSLVEFPPTAESLSPLGVGIGSESLTFNARWGVLSPAHLATYLGGKAVHSAGFTTFSKGVNHEPSPFDLRMKNPSDGGVYNLILYRCIIENMPIVEPGPERTFKLTGISGRAYGQGPNETDNLFSIVMPGNFNNSS